ncbi:conserved hypothetical protein (plasmid) [Pseudomonas savastanoi pv. phaseolicola 1448A]|uniref:HNH endonuclease n=2 Tax=Pseudomonas savastanoi TaxID=29438 RepID=Q48B28_PSE14|nr:conserved hypothetical protein [Pseudomonas savastanoi pv. phaseolicola 1448A]
MTTPQKSRRREFSPATRRILAGAAGHICSFTNCPRTTIGPTVKGNGDSDAKGVAVAAHVYAAAPKGPRPAPESMSEKEIESPDNGVWMCPSHADTVDKLQYQYPPAMLLEMKKVREFTQGLALVDTTIEFVAHQVGIKRIDRIVRNHLPSLDVALITRAAMDLFIRLDTAEKITSSLPPMPASFSHLTVTALTAKIHEVIESVDFKTRDDSHVWREVVAAWNEQRTRYSSPQEPNTSTTFANACLKIGTRCPTTGVISPHTVNTEATAAVIAGDGQRYLNGERSFRMIKTGPRTHSFNWDLRVFLDNEGYKVTSEITPGGDVLPSRLQYSAQRKAFESYARVLDQIAAGWKPIGFIGLSFEDGSATRDFHPTPVEIRNLISSADLDRLLKRKARALLGYKLADQFNVLMRFTGLFFHSQLSDEIIEKAFRGFFTDLAPSPLPRFMRSQPLVFLGKGHCIQFCIKKGEVYADAGYQ